MAERLLLTVEVSRELREAANDRAAELGVPVGVFLRGALRRWAAAEVDRPDWRV